MAKTPDINLKTDFKRNYLINGNFDIWQRGTSATINTPASTYLADRWTSYNGNDGTLIVTRQTFGSGQTDVPGFPTYFQRCQMTVASTQSAYTQQRIEDVKKLAGKKATLTFWAKANASMNVGIRTIQSFGSGGSSTVDTLQDTVSISTTWTKYIVIMDVPDVAGKTIVDGNNNYLNISFAFPTGTTFTFDIAQVQLVEGAEEVDFSLAGIEIAEELRLCQRYFWRFGANAYSTNPFFAVGYFDTTTVTASFIKFPVEMRGMPTLSVSNSTDLLISRASSSTASGTGVVTFSNRSQYGAIMNVTSGSASTIGFGTVIGVLTAGWIQADIEL